jgi:hypothetical protein
MLAARTGSSVVADERDDERDDEPVEAEVRRLRVLQWSVPALTGALVAMDAFMGEQQRPGQVVRGTLERLLPDALRAA